MLNILYYMNYILQPGVFQLYQFLQVAYNFSPLPHELFSCFFLFSRLLISSVDLFGGNQSPVYSEQAEIQF